MQAGSSSKLEFVYRQCEERILSGLWPIGSQIPTEIELSSEFECSRSTVGKAIAQLVHEQLVERRTRAGTRVISNSVRRSAPALDLEAFAFIYPSDQHDGIWRTVKGFQSAAHQRQRRVLMLSTGADYLKEMEYLTRLDEFNVRAAVIYPLVASPRDQLEFSRALLDCPFPVILLDLNLFGLHVPSVSVDNFHAGHIMTQQLIDGGLRRIGFFSNHACAMSITERYQGYCWAMETAGIPIEARNVFLEPTMSPNFGDPLNEPLRLGKRYLEQSDRLEGVVCGNDTLAYGLIHAAQAAGVRVPMDLKVTGIDALAPFGEGEIKLTTYKVPFEAMGNRAFETLDALVQGRTPPDLGTRVRGTLVIGDSA